MKENKEYKLKPCPFCGGEAVLKESRQPDGNCSYKCAIIKCRSCGCNTGYYTIDGYYGATTTIQDTVNAWNKRFVNGASDGYDIADQVHFSGRDVSVTTVLYSKSNQITDEQWKNAIEHLNTYIIEYASIGWAGQFGLNGVLIPLKKRFDKGERTHELYDAIMKVE